MRSVALHPWTAVSDFGSTRVFSSNQESEPAREFSTVTSLLAAEDPKGRSSDIDAFAASSERIKFAWAAAQPVAMFPKARRRLMGGFICRNYLRFYLLKTGFIIITVKIGMATLEIVA